MTSTPQTANAGFLDFLGGGGGSSSGGAADYKAVAKDIAAIIKSDPDKGPTLVRLVSILTPSLLIWFVDIYI